MSQAPDAGWLRSRRWFAGKSREIANVDLEDCVELPFITLAVVRVSYASGPSELYSLGLPLAGESDAFETEQGQRALFRLLAQGGEHGPVRFEPLDRLPADPSQPRPMRVEQSNTSVGYGQDWILKLLRRIEPGENRDLRIGRFLTLEAGFPHTPRVAGAITYRGSATLGVLQRFVPNQGDGWTYVRSQLDALIEDTPNAPDDVYWAQNGLPDRDEPLLAEIELLGRITGEMHRALASRPDLPAFAPEPCTDADLQAWLADLEAQRTRAGEPAPPIPAAHLDPMTKIQIHGDYHLGQVLKTPDGFSIVDFEGEPARSLQERSAKQPALRDVAGMLRSLHYAAWATALAAPERKLDAWADGWARSAGHHFLHGWRQTSGHPFDARLLRLLQLSKAYYELNYELNNRPSWAEVPRRGIRALTAHG